METSYVQKFNAMDKLLPASLDRTYKDILIHEYFMLHGNEECKRISFRAVVAHVRTEMKDKHLNNTYTDYFHHHNWCDRVLQGWVL